MIRINLYQSGPKPRRGKRVAAPVISVEGGGTGLFVLAVIVIVAATVAGNGAWYWKLNHDTQRIRADMRKAELEYARLTQVKAKYQEREKQKDMYKRRIDVIDQLRASQSGPVELLGMLGDTVNRTDAVWLSSMTDDGKNINLKGFALSVHGVADLMRNLQNTGRFKAVDIKTSYQDERIKELQAFVFELSCEKQATRGPAQPVPQAKKS